MSKTYLAALVVKDQKVNPLFNTLKARLVLAEDEQAEIRMPVTEDIVQGGGMVAGGILATLADEAMAHAVLSSLDENVRAVTSEMNIRYLRGASPQDGGELVAQARVVRMGRQICVTEAQVSDDRNRLLATAGASFFLIPDAR